MSRLTFGDVFRSSPVLWHTPSPLQGGHSSAPHLLVSGGETVERAGERKVGLITQGGILAGGRPSKAELCMCIVLRTVAQGS